MKHLRSFVPVLALLASSFVGCTASTEEPTPATYDELVASIEGVCEAVVVTCGEPDCGESEDELIDSVTRQSDGTPECDAALYREFVDYFDCLQALSCEDFNTDTACEAMIDQAQIDESCTL